MRQPESRSDAQSRGHRAEAILANVFAEAGWRVRVRSDSRAPDMIVRRGAATYVIEAKAAAEGRGDRLIPLWSQAYLQARRAADDKHPALAVIAAPRISARAADQVLSFAAQFAPDAAVGVIDFEGLRVFRGPHLEGLDSHRAHLPSHDFSASSERTNLFSDLNQWMLKVLLAPELPEKLLGAPRGQYENASQLARAANVSVMSAFRLVQQLEREGYLHESKATLKLVRREDLFRRWQGAVARRAVEVPMRFLLRGDFRKELARILEGRHACLALFAAAEAMGFGFVQGVPPYVYVQRLGPTSLSAWKNLVATNPGEPPDIILRKAQAPQSVFRAQVRAHDMPVSDILQVWLDVTSHPSRGDEQAELIRRRVLDPIIVGTHADG